MVVILAFWLAKPITLLEIIETTSEQAVIRDALRCLLELGCSAWVREHLHYLEDPSSFSFVGRFIGRRAFFFSFTQQISVSFAV